MVTEETTGQYLLSDPGDYMLSGVKNLNYFPCSERRCITQYPAETWRKKMAGTWRKHDPDASTPPGSGGYSNVSRGLKNGFLLFA